MASESRAERAAFLGVEQSLSGRRWAARLADEQAACHRPAPRPARRGVAPAGGAKIGLEDAGLPRADAQGARARLDVAVARLVRAVQAGEKIVVRRLRRRRRHLLGAAAAFFRSVGGNIGVYIPDRRKESYGPQRRC
jgi:single-stranded-DNA-specific exonuclease